MGTAEQFEVGKQNPFMINLSTHILQKVPLTRHFFIVLIFHTYFILQLILQQQFQEGY